MWTCKNCGNLCKESFCGGCGTPRPWDWRGWRRLDGPLICVSAFLVALLVTQPLQGLLPTKSTLVQSGAISHHQPGAASFVEESGQGVPGPEGQAHSPAFEKSYRILSTATAGSPLDKMLEQVAATVSTQSDSFALESDRSGEAELYLLDSVRSSRQLGAMDTATQFFQVPESALFQLPFLFDDATAAAHLLQGELRDIVGPCYESYGLKLVALYPLGGQYVTTTDIPLSTLEALEGRRINVKSFQIYQVFLWTYLGAEPLMLYEDDRQLYSDLKKGEMEGQAGPLDAILNSGLDEVQGHMARVPGLTHVGSLVMDLEAYQALSPQDQLLLERSCDQAVADYAAALPLWEQQQLTALAEAGLEISELSERDRLALLEAAQPVYDMFCSDYGSELVDRVLTAAGRWDLYH